MDEWKENRSRGPSTQRKEEIAGKESSGRKWSACMRPERKKKSKQNYE